MNVSSAPSAPRPAFWQRGAFGLCLAAFTVLGGAGAAYTWLSYLPDLRNDQRQTLKQVTALREQAEATSRDTTDLRIEIAKQGSDLEALEAKLSQLETLIRTSTVAGEKTQGSAVRVALVGVIDDDLADKKTACGVPYDPSLPSASVSLDVAHLYPCGSFLKFSSIDAAGSPRATTVVVVDTFRGNEIRLFLLSRAGAGKVGIETGFHEMSVTPVGTAVAGSDK